MKHDKLKAQLEALKAEGLSFADCISVFAEPENNPYVLAARECVEEGELEIDSKTVVSEGSDGGAYVMAWRWISNEAAGVVSHSDVLGKVYLHAKWVVDAYPEEKTEQMRLHRAQMEWLDETLLNFRDEIDGIEQEVVSGLPGSIRWIGRDGETYRFMPSDALNQMRLLAKQAGLPNELANQAESFSLTFGNKFDAILKSVSTDEEDGWRVAATAVSRASTA